MKTSIMKPHAPRPARQVCPLCSRDQVPIRVEGPGLWRYECTSGGYRHVEPYSWVGSATASLDNPADHNSMREFGLFDHLPECLIEGEPFVEYGVVEYRFSKLFPEDYQKMVNQYSHTRLGPTQYSASAFIAKALGILADWGVVQYHEGRATGYWSYNGTLSYWRLPDENANPGIMTYEEFALQNGVDPKT